MRDAGDRQFTDLELQILAMARALAPEILPFLAAVAAAARRGAPQEELQNIIGIVLEMDDPRRLPFPSYNSAVVQRDGQRESGWHAIVGFALTVAGGGRNGMSFRDAAQAWRQAHTGSANPSDDAPSPPMPLTQSSAGELLAFTDDVFARLLSSPDPRLRAWAVLNAGQLEGHATPPGPEIGPLAGD